NESEAIQQKQSLSTSASSQPLVELVKECQNQYLSGAKEIKALLETYIAPCGSTDPSYEDPFPLEEEVMKFLKSERQVLLLLGGSGSGKTTFGQSLTYQLWRNHKPEDPIPLFIPL